MRLKARQHGVIFLALALVLVVTGSTLALSALNNRQSAKFAEDAEVSYQLSLAKAALLSYAASSATLNGNARGPGFLPCPDTDNDGLPESTCDSSSAPLLGRLPEYETFSGSRFQLNDAYAGIDEQFWYVVGSRYVYNTSTASQRRSRQRTNATYASPYWLTLDGLTQSQSEYVAFIIAPGEELETQDRAAGPTSYANYLDGLNGSSGFDYYTSYSANPELFNDRLVAITLDEYMVYVGAAVAIEVKRVIDTYAASNAGVYPPDSGSLTSTTCSTIGVGTTFSELFNAEHTWLKDGYVTPNTAGNNERWSCQSGVYWNRLAATNTGELKFNGCTNLKFTLTYGGVNAGITRTGDGC